eukprot:TRINITY_DN6730_c0_g1_i10.p1 TRINITY_DN6730_c0_g1~~TRINITY_DN6730_c0_g1_i10.p1  ORF type:complete len:285 (-),score=21.46 TRINITY_DN6730_c0_g1_i10:554-1408(-)
MSDPQDSTEISDQQDHVVMCDPQLVLSNTSDPDPIDHVEIGDQSTIKLEANDPSNTSYTIEHAEIDDKSTIKLEASDPSNFKLETDNDPQEYGEMIDDPLDVLSQPITTVDYPVGQLKGPMTLTGTKEKSKRKKSTGPVSCPHCHKSFERDLQTHIRRIHSKFKPFTCEDCNKQFSESCDLKQHMSVHGKGKLYSCEDCGRQFKYRKDISVHRNRDHLGESTHFCPVCGKGFYSATDLTRHFRTHSKEKPYQCKNCLKKFNRNFSMKRHEKVCKLAPGEEKDDA